MTENHYLVPDQREGKEKDLSQIIVADAVEAAEDLFVDAKERLLDVNNWSRYSGGSGIVFRLADSHGGLVKRRARKRDHIRISLNGRLADEFDWVSIEAIEYDDYPDENRESFAIRVRPCIDPVHRKELDLPDTLPDNATSTFVITRSGKMLSAAYHGRNESDEEYAGGPFDTLVIASCAWLGLTDERCMLLLEGFLK